MKYALWMLTLAAVAVGCARPARAADLKILEPADKSILHGTVIFRIAPQDGPTDRFLSNPEISVQDEYGKEIERIRAARDPRQQICAAYFDTTKYKDGIYLVTVYYKTLEKGVVLRQTREDMAISIRNGSIRPAKFTVEASGKEYHAGDSCDLTVHVLDSRGQRMPGARVEFTVDKGDVNTNAEVSDGMGEAFASVDSDDPQTVTVTIRVENLPPVTRTIKFVP